MENAPRPNRPPDDFNGNFINGGIEVSKKLTFQNVNFDLRYRQVILAHLNILDDLVYIPNSSLLIIYYSLLITYSSNSITNPWWGSDILRSSNFMERNIISEMLFEDTVIHQFLSRAELVTTPQISFSIEFFLRDIRFSIISQCFS